MVALTAITMPKPATMMMAMWRPVNLPFEGCSLLIIDP